jgi:hypothetical protein
MGVNEKRPGRRTSGLAEPLFSYCLAEPERGALTGIRDIDHGTAPNCTRTVWVWGARDSILLGPARRARGRFNSNENPAEEPRTASVDLLLRIGI